MSEKDMKRRLLTYQPRLSAKVEDRLRQAIQARTAQMQPARKKRGLFAALLAVFLLALASTVSGFVSLTFLMVGCMAAGLILFLLLSWYSSAGWSARLRRVAALPLWLVAVLGVTLTAASSTFAIVNAPTIFVKLTGVTPKQQSTTGHTELELAFADCPSWMGDKAGKPRKERYILSAQATISETQAQQVLWAECANTKGQQTAMKYWPSLPANAKELPNGTVVTSHIYTTASQIENVEDGKVEAWNAGQKKWYAVDGLQLRDMRGKSLPKTALKKGAIVQPVFKKSVILKQYTDGRGRPVVSFSPHPGEATLAGFVILPSEIPFAMYNPDLEAQLLRIMPCVQNVQDDCVVALQRQNLLVKPPLPEPQLQGRVTAINESEIRLQTRPSGREIIVAFPAAERTSAEWSGLNIGSMIEVRYTKTANDVLINASEIGQLSLLLDVTEKRGRELQL